MMRFDIQLKREGRESLLMAKRGNFKWTDVYCRFNPRIPFSISISFFLIIGVPAFVIEKLVGSNSLEKFAHYYDTKVLVPVLM